MSAFHKALQGVYRGPPVTEFCVMCSSCINQEHDMDFGPDWTKFAFIKLAQSRGWTWDKDGNWLCPKCSEKGGEE